MTYLMYVLGCVGIVAGCGWGAALLPGVMTSGLAVQPAHQDLMYAGVAFATVPGIVFIILGLFFLAVGGDLSRLDRIVRNSNRSAAALKALLPPR